VFRGFAPTTATQEFIGAFAHRSISRAVKFFLNTGSAPSDGDMAELMEEVRKALKSEGARPQRWQSVARTGFQLMRLNRSLAESGTYERIVDSERVLKSFEETFVAEGVVDVIQMNDIDNIELWDYKASSNPASLSPDFDSDLDKVARAARLKDYVLQMCVYAHLHEQNYGVAPMVCRLLFINEIPLCDLRKVGWAEYSAEPIPGFAQPDSSNGLFLTITTADGGLMGPVLDDFYATACQIMECMGRDEWDAPRVLPGQKVCDVCDFRWSCQPACSVFGYVSGLDRSTATRGLPGVEFRKYTNNRDRDVLDLDGVSADLYKVLRTWRNQITGEDRELKRLLRNEILKVVAQRQPRSRSSLEKISGIGPKLSSLYGVALVAVVESHLQEALAARQISALDRGPVPHAWPELTTALSDRLYHAGLLFLDDLWPISPAELFEEVGLQPREWDELKRFLGVTRMEAANRAAARAFIARVDESLPSKK
jgi:hypothetical protein